MTNKPYYDCHIEALYMEDRFGMKFWDGEKQIMNPDDVGFRGDDDGRLYYEAFVHPDSLHILDPREDDQGYEPNKRHPFVFIGGKWRCATTAEPSDYVAIERRNNMPFFWPKGM